MNSLTFSSRQPGARLLYRFLTKFFNYAQGLANTGNALFSISRQT